MLVLGHIFYITNTYNNGNNNKIITFFSYGGMLSAYMRFKYPNIVTGSIAASAPINLLTETVNRNFFFAAVTKDFSEATPQCETKVRKAFELLMKTAAQGMSGNDVNNCIEFQYAMFLHVLCVCPYYCLLLLIVIIPCLLFISIAVTCGTVYQRTLVPTCLVSDNQLSFVMM